jgi:Fe-S-cluster-containing dehydrogenase component
MEETMFIDPQRCIGCRACVAACRECATHKGYSMIFVDYIDRAETTATMPTLCMHCKEPTCALVCPADAIKVSDDGVVMSALKPRCLDCRNCVNACPFGVPKYNTEIHLQMKCDMCYDRSSEGLKPMCASVCPTGAIAFGKYEQIVPLRRTKPVNVHVFGNQKVETKVFLMLPTDADEVKVDGCGVFEGMLTRAETEPAESWIDTQVEHSDKSNEF